MEEKGEGNLLWSGNEDSTYFFHNFMLGIGIGMVSKERKISLRVKNSTFSSLFGYSIHSDDFMKKWEVVQ